MKTEDLEKFRDEFDSYVKQNLKDEDFVPVQKIDALLNPAEANIKLAEDIDIEQVSAKHDNGILFITIPKISTPKAKVDIE